MFSFGRIIAIVTAVLAVVTYAIDVKCNAEMYDFDTAETYFYDLSILHHGPGYYTDLFSYRTDDNTFYYVNFCGQTAAACKTNDTSVCIRSPNGDFYSGGSTSTQKISFTPGEKPRKSVTISYSGGTECGTGDKRRTNFVLQCDESADPGYIYSLKETSRCEVTLYVKTKAACAEELPTPEGTCGARFTDDKMQTPMTYHYNLTTLHHDKTAAIDNLYYKNDENEVFYVNFCGQTVTGCQRKNASVCIRKANGKYVSGGSTPTERYSMTYPEYLDRGITVTYSNGDKCGSGKTYVTHLMVLCAPGVSPGQFDEYIKTSECEHTLKIRSDAGCGHLRH